MKRKLDKTLMKIGIVGTVGLPAKYGGFETLVENLADYHHREKIDCQLYVYCSSKSYKNKSKYYKNTLLKYVNLSANGLQSVLYDIVSMVKAVFFVKCDVLLVLGVSGAMFIPMIRLLSNTSIITNIDGIEWKRDKWKKHAKLFLRISERIAVRYSNEVIADNEAIGRYIQEEYRMPYVVITYGGDHVLAHQGVDISEYKLPRRYFFSVCRIERENNISMILEAFENLENQSIVMVGNWESSNFGLDLKRKYKKYHNIVLIDPIYNLSVLRSMREKCVGVVHGHSAGGTNPSLVEAMWFNKPIFAFDCTFNRETTENSALFFKSSMELSGLVNSPHEQLKPIGINLLTIAQKNYLWNDIAAKYFQTLCGKTEKVVE